MLKDEIDKIISEKCHVWDGSAEDVTDAIVALKSEREDRLESAIRWALGETDEFPPREEGQGAYWWRKELRERSGLEYEAKTLGELEVNDG